MSSSKKPRHPISQRKTKRSLLRKKSQSARNERKRSASPSKKTASNINLSVSTSTQALQTWAITGHISILTEVTMIKTATLTRLAQSMTHGWSSTTQE